MQIHTVLYGLKDGFRLKIVEKPAWAILVDRYWPAGPSKDPLSTAWWHLTQWVFKQTHKTERAILEVPISRSEASTMNPGAWDWARDDPAPATPGCPVRIRGSVHREVNGHIRTVREYPGGETTCDVELVNGVMERARLSDLIDTRLAWEK